MSEIPEDIFQTACGIVMEAESLKSMLKHKDVVDAIARAILAERERCADLIWHDSNRVLDRYYCCSAMDQGVQVCGCQGVSIRNELVSAILTAHPTPSVEMGRAS